MSKEICGKMKNISRAQESIKKNQMEALELKNRVTETRTAKRWI